MTLPIETDFTPNGANTGIISRFLVPTNFSVGQLATICLSAASGSNTPQFIAVSGWNLIGQVGDAVSDSHQALYTRRIDGTEGWTGGVSTVDITMVSAQYSAGRMSVWDNALDAVLVGTGINASPVTSIDVPSMTTIQDDCKILVLGGHDGSDGTSSISGTGFSLLGEHEYTADSGSGALLILGTKDQLIAGATGACTVGNTASDGMSGIMFALQGTGIADTTVPVINVVGGDTSVVQGGSYTPPTVTASDDTDGDITGDIVVTGSVDVNILGDHTVLYDVDDAAGNSAVTQSHTVNIFAPPAPTIDSVSGNNAEGTITIELDAYITGITATLDGNTLTNIVELDADTITADMPSTGYEYGASYDLIVTDSNGASNVFPVTYNPPLGMSVVTLTSDYASLPEASIVYQNADFSGLVIGDKFAYENPVDGIHSLSLDGELVATFDPAAGGNTYTVDARTNDASDSWAVEAGTFDITTLFDYAAQGGSVVGGNAVTSKHKSYTAVGGSVSGGSAALSKHKEYIGQGGSVSGGSAITSQSSLHEYIAQGGSVVGGSAIISKHKSYVAIGGSVSGGSAITSKQKVYVASGGSISGGIAVLSKHRSYISVGGSVVGGSAVLSYYSPTAPFPHSDRLVSIVPIGVSSGLGVVIHTGRFIPRFEQSWDTGKEDWLDFSFPSGKTIQSITYSIPDGWTQGNVRSGVSVIDRKGKTHTNVHSVFLSTSEESGEHTITAIPVFTDGSTDRWSVITEVSSN